MVVGLSSSIQRSFSVLSSSALNPLNILWPGKNFSSRLHICWACEKSSKCDVRQRLLFTDHFHEQRRNGFPGGYVADYDTSPLMADKVHFAHVTLTPWDIMLLVELPFCSIKSTESTRWWCVLRSGHGEPLVKVPGMIAGCSDGVRVYACSDRESGTAGGVAYWNCCSWMYSMMMETEYERKGEMDSIFELIHKCYLIAICSLCHHRVETCINADTRCSPWPIRLTHLEVVIELVYELTNVTFKAKNWERVTGVISKIIRRTSNTQGSKCSLLEISVLKSGPVRSFAPILRQPDRNRSFDFPDLRQPDWDRSRLVHVGPHSGPDRLQPVFTKTGPRPVHNWFKVIFMNVNVN